jgi:hypothetical protein
MQMTDFHEFYTAVNQCHYEAKKWIFRFVNILVPVLDDIGVEFPDSAIRHDDRRTVTLKWYDLEFIIGAHFQAYIPNASRTGGEYSSFTGAYDDDNELTDWIYAMFAAWPVEKYTPVLVSSDKNRAEVKMVETPRAEPSIYARCHYLRQERAKFCIDSIPPTKAAIESARRTSLDLCHYGDIPRPNLFPAPDGGVQAGWTIGRWAATVSFAPDDGSIDAEATHGDTGEKRNLDMRGIKPTTIVTWLRSLASNPGPGVGK